MQEQITRIIEQMRATAPLVHNITNYVVMQVTANALLAAGASPLMSHAEDEMEDLLSIASALVLNIGTLDATWVKAMESAAAVALTKQVPVVLDPVGAGASAYRTAVSLSLLQKAQPVVLRGNASEIMAVAGEQARTKGVDSANASGEALPAALALAVNNRTVVCISGEEDIITDGSTVARVRGGSPLMCRVTGMGCTATALCAAHAAAAKALGLPALAGAAAAMAVMAEAGSAAHKNCQGPGSFIPAFMDALYSLNPAAAANRVRVEHAA